MRLSTTDTVTFCAALLRGPKRLSRTRIIAVVADRCGWSAFSVELLLTRLVERGWMQDAVRPADPHPTA